MPDQVPITWTYMEDGKPVYVDVNTIPSRSDADLVKLCDLGLQDACVELDRRGVEPPVLEPDKRPVPTGGPWLPVPGHLRDLASSLRAEADELEEQRPELITLIFGALSTSEAQRLMNVTLKSGIAQGELLLAGATLLRLADAVEEMQRTEAVS